MLTTPNDLCLTLAAGGMEHLPILTTIAAAFAAAWVFGLITHKLGLSPIVGYLLAGVAIGKYTPGFSGDETIAAQLAEVGVILLMFGVGLHFKLSELLAVKRVAIPGAVVQSAVATLGTIGIFMALGWPLKSTIVLGMAMAVASTVVLLRVLMDRKLLTTTHGHVAVGWLIVEDVFTVLALVIVPIIATSTGSVPEPATTAAVTDAATTTAVVAKQSPFVIVGMALLKLLALVAIVYLAGSKVVPWMLERIARLRSGELFTLTVLVLSIAIAVGSAALFGASVALGAFLAGMVVAQSPLSHQAAADALPLRDAFAVIFFVSVGMMLNPMFLIEHPGLVAAGLAVVLLLKPIAALGIVALLGYPARTAIIVAISLSQIGEFSFILAQAAGDHGLFGESKDSAMNVLVATAMISITINPILMGQLDRVEALAQRVPWFWNMLNARAQKRSEHFNADAHDKVAKSTKPLAIIVGYGPVGRVVDALLRDAGLDTVIIDMNIDTVQQLTRSGRAAIYGDATHPEVLEHAGVDKAVHLIVTLPHASGRSPLVLAAKELNPDIEITVRARYLAERDTLRQAGANYTVVEEGEAGIALARHVMHIRGVEPNTVDRLLAALRKVWGIELDSPTTANRSIAAMQAGQSPSVASPTTSA